MLKFLEEIADIEHKLGIRRTVVLFVTLWMTYRAFEWAADYSVIGTGVNGIEAAAIIAAVTAPITYLQKVVFDAYLQSKKE